MELHNSPLSEIACLGFEYGYSMEAPETLVLWEAQFGDFVNSAQVIIDQFIVSALSKWGQTTRLTLLLPHGYEGSGPEHSSARLERFLTLAAEGNIRVANLTTPAQYFHLLRRQARVAKQRPLVIMTRSRSCACRRRRRESSTWGARASSRSSPSRGWTWTRCTRLVLCTGKIYYDLEGHATRENNEGVAMTRVELLYPFPQAQILEEVRRYPNLKRSSGSRRSRATWAPARTCRRACCRSCRPRSSSATSAGRSAPRRARATRPRTPSSRRGSSAPRSISRAGLGQSRPSSRASAAQPDSALQARNSVAGLVSQGA